MTRSIHYVFDCTTTVTRRDIRVRSAWAAKLLATVMSKVTGRMHDYDTAARYHATCGQCLPAGLIH